MTIIDVSINYMDWRAAVRKAKETPDLLIWQYRAARMQANLVMVQALYWRETR